jgi:hypothetical protein
METKYITRNGSIALIDGLSEYYLFGEDHIILTGTVDGVDCTWGKNGRVRINQVIGLKEKHSMDLVSWIDDSVEGLHYFEFKGKKK